MNRRELSILLPAMLAQAAQTKSKLPSKTYIHEELTVKKNPNGNVSRAIFDGLTHTGFSVDIHETELAPGQMPHPAHSHEHEEILLLREGTVEVTISGKVSVLTPGSVAYVASGEHHGWRNIGKEQAKYFVMALGRS